MKRTFKRVNKSVDKTAGQQRCWGHSYLSVLCGMVGSMETMAPDESSRDRLVFLHKHKNTRFTGSRLQVNTAKRPPDEAEMHQDQPQTDDGAVDEGSQSLNTTSG